MKASIVAASAVLLGSASAAHLGNRHAHAHELFEKRGEEVCETYTSVITNLIWTPTPYVASNTSVVASTSAPSNYTVPTTGGIYTTSAASTTVPVITTTPTTAPATVPTPAVETCPTPGTYTFPATTVVVTETTTVCGASTTSVPAGTHTLGGVTTVVETATTVVCPYATTSTATNGVVTSVIELTTYVCPSAGTYTIAPITTVVVTDTIVTCPVVTSFVPGTYTKTALTTTVTETDVVITCPFEGVATTSTVVPTTTAVPVTEVAVPATTTEAAATASSTSESEIDVSVGVSVGLSASSTTSSVSVSASVSVSLGSDTDHWAITYTPYTTEGACKGASDVLSDLTEIKSKGFTTVRVYSTDCDTLPNVGAGCEELGLTMIIGVFIGEVGCDNGSPDVASQISAIKEWAQWDLVDLVVVGNEAALNGYCTASQLATLITEVKTIISEAGKSTPVTTTDTVNIWQDTSFSSVICDVVDVVACNAHAYFNAETAPADAGTFVSGQLDIVKAACGGGKEGYVMESGWPSACVANGLATCSVSDQETAIASLRAALGGSIVFFSYSDDAWKDDGSCACEQHWGCGQLFSL